MGFWDEGLGFKALGLRFIWFRSFKLPRQKEVLLEDLI